MGVLTSVVIAARNAEATLATALDCLIAQTAENWEAIIVDDGSTDATRTIVSAYAARDARFSVIAGSGAGVSAARNLGLARAVGKRLLFLDSDDWVAPGFLEALGAALDSSPRAVAAYCAYQRVTPEGRLTEVRFSTDLGSAPFEVMARRCGAPLHCFLVNRQLVDRLGGFDESLKTCEEWDLWQRAARMGGQFVFVPMPLAFYRMSPASLSRDVGAMISDAEIVISRGFSTDRRVAHPAPAHADGANPAFGGSVDLALSYFTLWCAAHEAGRGASIDQALMKHRLVDFKDEFNLVVEVIFEALYVGAMCAPSGLASRWPCFASPLCELLKRLEAASSYSGLARRLQYSLERRILYATDMRATTVLGLTAVASIDVRRPAALPLPPTVDRLLVTIHAGEKWLGMTEMPVFASMSSREIAKVALQTIGLRTFVRESAALRQPRTWVAGALTMAHGFTRRVCKPDRAGMLPLAREVLQSAALAIAGPSSTANTSNQILEHIIATARREGQANGGCVPRAESMKPTGEIVYADRRSYWEAMFATVDPWNYGSDYEQVKYERTLTLVPAGTKRALELACAEGHFTAQLACRVEHLTATDISQTALNRAQARCSGLSNIVFKRLDLATDSLPEGFDLIVCSEVLYFLDGRDALAFVCSRLKDSLAPGGRLLSAHAFVLKDDLSRTAFDWEGPYGAAVISDTMSRTPGLALEASIETELYRIDLFRRSPPDERPVPPRVERVPLGAALEPKVARQVIWGGANIRRADAQRSERTERLPILAYHRIVDDGPPALARYRTRPEMFRAQMRWLRSQGYHTVSAAELVQRLIHREKFPGRPVMITFDDGTDDFYDTAWPILRDCDLSAEVFIVTDLVGNKAIWDAEYGRPAPLMGADKIKSLVREGVRFGSHLATHRAPDGLASAELAAELARSRSVLEAWTGAPVTEFAAPYGMSDDRLINLARRCGYDTIFTSHQGVAQLGDDPYRLPRIGVHGHWGLDRFIEYLESAR